MKLLPNSPCSYIFINLSLILLLQLQLNMVQKRLFDEDESNEVSSKHPRQMELNSQLVSSLEFPPEPVVQSCHNSGVKGAYECPRTNV